MGGGGVHDEICTTFTVVYFRKTSKIGSRNSLYQLFKILSTLKQNWWSLVIGRHLYYLRHSSKRYVLNLFRLVFKANNAYKKHIKKKVVIREGSYQFEFRSADALMALLSLWMTDCLLNGSNVHCSFFVQYTEINLAYNIISVEFDEVKLINLVQQRSKYK